MPRRWNGLGPVVAAAVAAGAGAAWLLVFVEESRCDRGGLVWLTILALLLTLAPTVVALTTKAYWWLGVLLTGVSLLLLLAVFRPGGVYDCYQRIAG
jgi:hypothetical protein